MRPEGAGGGEAGAAGVADVRRGRRGGRATGLAHVATVSFLASRAAPSLQFFFALGGGIALARVAAQRGARTGYGAALASMLQTVAVMGPARINAPLTQAITAPMMGRLRARGARPLTEFLACLALRLVHYTVLLAAFIFVILGGLDEFTGSYETLTGWLGIVPQGATAALAVTAAVQVLWAIFFSAIQVAAYRRALGDWPLTETPRRAGAAAAAAAERGSGRFDPRAIVVAALLASALLIASTSWALLLGVTAWLIPAWLLSQAGPRRRPARPRARRPARVRRAHRRAAERRRAGADAAPRAARRPARRGRDLDARGGRAGRLARGVPARAAPPARAARGEGGGGPDGGARQLVVFFFCLS